MAILSRLKNLVSNLKKCSDTAPSFEVVTAPVTRQIGKFTVYVDDIIIAKNLQLTSKFPAIMCYYAPDSFKIICNQEFLTLPQWVQEAYCYHEEGHFVNQSGMLQKDRFRLDSELEADLYSQKVTGAMYEALLYYSDKYPLLTEHERLETLEEHLKKCSRSSMDKVFDRLVRLLHK